MMAAQVIQKQEHWTRPKSLRVLVIRKALTEEVASKNNASDSEARTLDQAEKPKDASNKEEYGSASKKEDDTVTPRKSQSKPTNHEGVQEETPRTSTKRKNTPGKEKASDLEHGENLVGSKVKVFWPKDKEQVIKRKGNMSSETTSKRQKVEGSAKSKQKDTPTKTGSISKDDGKAESGCKGNSQKASKKSADNRSKDQSQKSLVRRNKTTYELQSQRAKPHLVFSDLNSTIELEHEIA
ncbi:hypothetical protein SASPL_141745 [Salvia splendens]|uniref:Uncharacterized protein n=1 Tax=Salvia splendens TaxID=180675 RepID=A0A8X8Z849_SALSN|nr:hypothetical protein SASPL_141745 [Salvia splendens]